MSPLKIPDGFPGQKIIVLPDSVINRYTRSSPGKALFATDIGYFPNARHHYFRRDVGAAQHILIYCVDGEGWFSTSGKRKKVKAGQWFIIPRHTPHRYGANAVRPWSIYWVHFAGTESDYFVKHTDAGAHPQPIDVGEDSSRIKMWEEMYAAVESGYGTENIGIMCISLWRFLGSFVYAKRYTSLFNRAQLQPVDSVIEFMKENVYRRLMVTEIAKQSNFSVSHFSMLFKKYTGYAPLDYFLHLKIQKACQFLDYTDFRIKEISMKLGYDDPNFFSRLFSKIMGQSPQQYRIKNKG